MSGPGPSCLTSADVFQSYYLKEIFQECHQSVKQFGPRSGLTFVRPDMGPNCLQTLGYQQMEPTGRALTQYSLAFLKSDIFNIYTLKKVILTFTLP